MRRASERKVCKIFVHNLVLFIKDTEAESARDPDAMQRLQKIRNIVFITQLLGVIDVLRHVKNLSLALQRVNALPWELEGEIAVSLDLLRMLAADLEQGKLDRMLPPACAQMGSLFPHLNFCGGQAAALCISHSVELQQLRFSMYEKDRQITQ